jgi:DNA-binding NtrC family response regulator
MVTPVCHVERTEVSGMGDAREGGTTVLVVADDPKVCSLVAEELGTRGVTVAVGAPGSGALGDLVANDVDVIVVDVDRDGLTLCRHVAASAPDVPVLALTASGNLDSAIAVIRAGAYDVVTKPPEPAALALAVQRAAEQRRLRQEVTRLRRETEGAPETSGARQKSQPQDHAWIPSLAEAERLHILRVLRLAKGSRRDAAMLLGIDRKTLYRKLRDFEPPEES